MTMAWGAGINNVQGLNLPLWEASGTKRQRHRGVRAVEKEREGSRVWGEGKAGYSGAGILFPFLESPELALNSKGRLLCFWCRQINVNLLLLILGLLGTPSFPCRQLRVSLMRKGPQPFPQAPNTVVKVHFLLRLCLGLQPLLGHRMSNNLLGAWVRVPGLRISYSNYSGALQLLNQGDKCLLSSLIPKCFLGGSVVKNPPANVGDASLIPGLGRSPGQGNGNTIQYSCLGNPMDRGAWWDTVHGVTKSQTWLSD